MSIQVVYPALAAGLLLLILVRLFWFKVEMDDVPSAYKLFAARDAMIRLVVDGRISRADPHFSALYENVNMMLCSSRLVSGPSGWPLAAYGGMISAHEPHGGAKLNMLPAGALPEALMPVAKAIQGALNHLVNNHFGIMIQSDSRRREGLKLQQRQAQQFLKLLPT